MPASAYAAARTHVDAAAMRLGLAAGDLARGSVPELVWDLCVAAEEFRAALDALAEPGRAGGFAVAVLDETLVERLAATRGEGL